MSHERIMKLQHDALMKFSKGDRKVVLGVIGSFGAEIRKYILSRSPEKVTSDDICDFLRRITTNN